MTGLKYSLYIIQAKLDSYNLIRKKINFIGENKSCNIKPSLKTFDS